jgi:hypothetical protein
MKKLGRFPLVGSFVAFSSEAIRTTVKSLQLIQSDMKDPDLRPLARKRIVGMALAHSWMFAIGSASMASFGIDEDEEETIRKLGSPWIKNSNLAAWGRNDKGQLQTIDLSFLDPYNIWHKPLVGLMRDQPVDDMLTSVAWDIISPFLGVDIGAGALYEVISNKKIRGGPIYNESAPGLEQSAAIAEHLINSLAPGVWRPTMNIRKAISGDKNQSTGRVYDLEEEVKGLFGLRITTFDPKLSLYYRTGDFKEALSNSNFYLGKVAGDVNIVDQDDLEDAYTSANEIRNRAYDDMMLYVNAARIAGISDNELRKVLRSSNVPKKYVSALVRGKKAPQWRIGKTFLRGKVKRAKILIDRETASNLRDRRRQVMALSRLPR